MFSKAVFYISCLILVIGLAGSAVAIPILNVDIGNSAWQKPGWISWDGTNGGWGWDDHVGENPPWEQHDDRSLSADYTLGSGVSFKVNGYSVYPGSGGKYGGWNSPIAEAGPLSRDFFYGHTKGTICVLWIKNLPAGSYDVISYHNDPDESNQHGPFDIFVNDVLVVPEVWPVSVLSDDDIPGVTIPIIADGINDVEIRFNGLYDSALLNGFTLTPEPTTMILLGMGGLALLRRKR